jgi:hypothetical protein
MAKKSRKRGSSANLSKPVNGQPEGLRLPTRTTLVTAALNFGTALMKLWQDNHVAVTQFFHTFFRLKLESCSWMSRHLLDLSAAA